MGFSRLFVNHHAKSNAINGKDILMEKLALLELEQQQKKDEKRIKQEKLQKRLLEKKPGKEISLFDLLQIVNQVDFNSETIKSCTQSIIDFYKKKSPTNPVAHLTQAIFFEKTNRSKLAIKEYESIERVFPKFVQAYLYHAWLLRSQHKYIRAKEIAEELLYDFDLNDKQLKTATEIFLSCDKKLSINSTPYSNNNNNLMYARTSSAETVVEQDFEQDFDSMFKSKKRY